MAAALAAAGGCGGSPAAPTPPPPKPLAVTLTCPADAQAVSLDGQPLAVTYASPTVGGGTAPFTTACTPTSASSFPIGSTAVTCSVQDAAGQSASCGFTVHIMVAPRMAATRFVAFGDSMTEGVVSAPLPAPTLVPAAESYPSRLLVLLQNRYIAQTITVVNAGKSGERASEGLGRLPDVIKANAPEILLLLEGANDLIAYMKADPGVTRAAGAVDELVKEAMRRNVRVFLATLPPWRSGGPKQLDASLPPLLNEEIRKIALNKGAVLVDLYGAMAGDVDTLIGTDGLHPTEAGYGRIAQTFFDVIRANLETSPPPGPPATGTIAWRTGPGRARGLRP